MTASDKIKQLIVFVGTGVKHNTPEEVRAAFDAFEDEGRDAESSVRCGQYQTNIGGEYSRHYESRSVASQMLDGSWVGWTYFYGGGKHGEPETMPWIDDAYDVVMTEVPTIVKEFKKA